MIETSLKKFLLSMLKKEYPKIKDIHISTTDMGYAILYRVGIGLKYDDLPETREENQLKSRVKELSKYILDNRGMIEQTFFYDPT
jgi:type II secretory ATPase GspE/PulE/Tfp pilus assembly ATPase PilB-like protein